MAETSALTRLEAVNLMLRAIGQSGVASLSNDDANPDITSATETLDVTLREVLMRGWHANTEKSYPIDPSPEGYLVLPLNTLSVDTSVKSKELDLVWRGTRLYDRVKHTFAVGVTVNVDLILGLEFEELPQSLRYLVAVKATRKFAADTSAGGAKFTQQDEDDALIAAEAEDSTNDDRTMAQASPHVARMRRGQRRAG